jgi:arabinogalactan endo-1,4-beta-galactosidase
MLKFGLFLTLIASIEAALTFKGVDWSSTIIEESAGKSWKNTAGTVQPIETSLKASGVNTVRQRVWVSSSSQYNLNYNLKLAKRAKAAGLNVYLDLHYSDTWADPGHQVRTFNPRRYSANI